LAYVALVAKLRERWALPERFGALFGVVFAIAAPACAVSKRPPAETSIVHGSAVAPSASAPSPAVVPVDTEAAAPLAASPVAVAPATEPKNGPPFWPKATSRGIGEVKVDFYKYLQHVHVRIHPIFAEQFLPSLAKLPPSDPLHSTSLSTTIAVVVRGKNGALEGSQVVTSSGVQAFDAGALDALRRAFPADAPPASCWSSDERVYFTWTFLSSPEACGTWLSQPFKLDFER
jgi:hypothetical protein